MINIAAVRQALGQDVRDLGEMCAMPGLHKAGNGGEEKRGSDLTLSRARRVIRPTLVMRMSIVYLSIGYNYGMVV